MMENLYATNLSHTEIVAVKLIHGLNLIERAHQQNPDSRRLKLKELLQERLARIADAGYEMRPTEEDQLNRWLYRIDPDYIMADSRDRMEWLDTKYHLTI